MASRKLKEPCPEAVKAFVRGVTSEVNATDVSRMMTLQQHMYVARQAQRALGGEVHITAL